MSSEENDYECFIPGQGYGDEFDLNPAKFPIPRVAMRVPKLRKVRFMAMSLIKLICESQSGETVVSSHLMRIGFTLQEERKVRSRPLTYTRLVRLGVLLTLIFSTLPAELAQLFPHCTLAQASSPVLTAVSGGFG
jgi:hypothetical protein